MKSLMRFEPATRVIDDPGLADRVTGVRMAPMAYETAEDLATEKRMRAQVSAGKAASPAQPSAKARAPSNDRSRESLHSDNRERRDSHPASKKRQWTVPNNATDESKSDRDRSRSGSNNTRPIEEKKMTTATFGGE